MKKVLVAAILGLAVVTSVKAQSAIQLYSYGTSGSGNIVYGAASGGTIGQGVTTGFTVGVYYALGNVVTAVNGVIGGSTTTGGANAGSLVGSGVTLGTGVGATAAMGNDGGFAPGEYGTTSSYVIPGAALTGNPTVTLVVVAYNGASYETSSIRGHSAAFSMTANSSPTFALLTGNFQPGFAVVGPIPEPSTFALAGLGLAGLLIFRRRK